MRLVLASLLLAGCVPGVSNGNSSSSGSPVDIEQPGSGGGGGGSDTGSATDTASNDTGGWVDTGGGGGGDDLSGRFVAADVLAGGISNPDMGEYPCEGDLEIIVDGTSFTGTANCVGSSAGTWEFTLYGSIDGGTLYGTMDAVLAGWDCPAYEDALVSGGVSVEGGYVDLSVVSNWTPCGYDYNWDFTAFADLMPG